MMLTVREALAKGEAFLRSKEVSSPRRSMEDLLAWTLSCSRLDLYMNIDQPIEEKERLALRSSLKELANHVPFAYISRKEVFYGLSLLITEDVLIPRPETEILVDLIVKRLQKVSLEKASLWDICTGSGAIGLALKKTFPLLDVTLSDSSSKALAVAKKNGKKHALDVSYLKGDLLQPFAGKKARFIVANPPYLSQNAYANSSLGLKKEPKEALIGGEMGWEIYAQFAQDLPGYLEPQGAVFFEIGYDQGESVPALFHSPCWVKKEILQDWSGQPRFFFLERE